jgi:hypothetical protein
VLLLLEVLSATLVAVGYTGMVEVEVEVDKR